MLQPPQKRVSPVSIQFRDAKTPYSPHFQDIYFTPSTGIEESRYVYLEGSGFLASVSSPEANRTITVAEIGFGVGLNFLVTLKEFMERAHQDTKLHYTSVEKFPVLKADLIQLYEAYPELKTQADALLGQYPILVPGVHRLYFFNHRVILDLVLGDALELLPELEFKAQHWYWDGFAPARNEDAFSKPLFEQVARLSAKGARGSSFTAATWVRNTLKDAGFKIEKRPGFGPKRECIVGTFEKEEAPSPLSAWFSSQSLKKLKSKNDTIAILGAGLAGSSIARRLANLGFKVTVYDGHGIGKRASGNTAGLFNVQLSKVPNPISRFSQLSLSYFLRELQELQIPNHLGILRKEADLRASLQNSDYPDSFYQLNQDEAYFPECGIINPQVLCERRMNHPHIRLVERSIARVNQIGEQFELIETEGLVHQGFDHVVYAVGADLRLPENKIEHLDLHALPVRPIRGQVILVNATEESKKLQSTKVDGGYVSPLAPFVTGHSLHLIGATYQAKKIEENQEALDTQKLILEAKEKWSEFASLSETHRVSTRVGHRLSTPDKLPMMGPVCNAHQTEKDYGHAFKGSEPESLPDLHGNQGEWLLLGLGSRGITFSSLSSEILCSMMLGVPLPIELDLLPHLHSSRFLIRNLKRPKVN